VTFCAKPLVDGLALGEALNTYVVVQLIEPEVDRTSNQRHNTPRTDSTRHQIIQAAWISYLPFRSLSTELLEAQSGSTVPATHINGRPDEPVIARLNSNRYSLSFLW
jgi:hypothetical protein